MGGKKGKKKAKKAEPSDEMPDLMSPMDSLLDEIDPTKWAAGADAVAKGPCTIDELPAGHGEK